MGSHTLSARAAMAFTCRPTADQLGFGSCSRLGSSRLGPELWAGSQRVCSLLWLTGMCLDVFPLCLFWGTDEVKVTAAGKLFLWLLAGEEGKSEPVVPVKDEAQSWPAVAVSAFCCLKQASGHESVCAWGVKAC